MSIKNKYYLMVPVVLVGALAWAAQGSGASAVLTKKEAKALEATANTPEEHMKLATYYSEQARKFDEKVRYNEEMAESYRQHSFPLNGKMAVPMWRRCQDWASEFAEEEKRAMALAKFHAAKAFRSEAAANAFADPDQFRPPRTSVADRGEFKIQVTSEQSSLFSNWIASSNHFYDLTRIGRYVLNAKGQPQVELVQLQTSAAALFDAEQRFVETLTGTQRAALRSNLHGIEKRDHDIEERLNRLTTGMTSPASICYFKTVSGLKRDLERSNVEQHAIASRLGFSDSSLRSSSCVVCVEWRSAKQTAK